jgi:hypothetical protein
MVSCAGELFRQSGCDETYEAKIRMISISGKLEDFSAGIVPRTTQVPPAGAHSTLHGVDFVIFGA